MEGVTDRRFRTLVLDLGGCGAATTEFVRLTTHPVPTFVFERELGPVRTDTPVAIQIMAARADHLTKTVARAEEAGAAWIDLNFGCPVKRVCGRGAGSALLDDPTLLGHIVAVAAEATTLPVSAKIRAGVRDASRLEDILDAAVEGGAALITMHARVRTDSYSDPARWEWLARAVAHLDGRCPLVGNGSIATPADVTKVMAETGCAAVMIGRGAIANPFVFRECMGRPRATPAQAAAFAVRYLDELMAETPRGLGRFKQMLRSYSAGSLLSEDQRRTLLRTSHVAPVRDWFAALAQSTA